MLNTLKNWFCDKANWPRLIFGSSIFLVFLSFLLFYLIDLRNALGLRDWLFSVNPAYFYFTYTPFFFQHYGRNSGFVELLQWGFLAGSIGLAGFLTGYYYLKEKWLSIFLGLMTATFILMLFEDAGDIRHMLMSYIQLAADEPDQGLWGTAFEGLYFAVLGGLPLYALVRYGRRLRDWSPTAFVYLVAGFIAHAIAASLSFVGTAFQGLLDKDLYTIMGEGLVALSYRLGDSALPAHWESWNQTNWLYQVGFYLMDSLIEENLELIGYAAFLSCLTILHLQIEKRD